MITEIKDQNHFTPINKLYSKKVNFFPLFLFFLSCIKITSVPLNRSCKMNMSFCSKKIPSCSINLASPSPSPLTHLPSLLIELSLLESLPIHLTPTLALLTSDHPFFGGTGSRTYMICTIMHDECLFKKYLLVVYFPG